MKWINCKERLPEFGKEVIWKAKYGFSVDVTMSKLYPPDEDIKVNYILFYEDYEDPLDLEDCYWLDESEEDLESLKKEFESIYMDRTYNSNPMNYQEIGDWWVNKLKNEEKSN